MPNKIKMNQSQVSKFIIALIVIILIGAFAVLLIFKVSTWQNQSQHESQAQDFIGLSREDAKKKAHEEGYRYTEGSIDGKPNVVDAMFDPNRITVTIEKGRVVKAEFDRE